MLIDQSRYLWDWTNFIAFLTSLR